MVRNSFDKELEHLHGLMLKMSSIVEESIENSVLAFKKQDVSLAKQVFENDDAIDDMESRIEKICINLIARQQPLAKDLRAISTALKIITDLERIGDQAADIAELTIRIGDSKQVKPLIDIPHMADMAKKMVTKSIDSYVKQDINLAKEVCDSDDAIDNLFSKIVLELINIMKNNPSTVEQATDYMFVVKYLERIGDHATNIAEWVVFNVTGSHDHLARKNE
ncbi:phosphate signaling complex protein PhoU [Ruminiclostridium cellulolyticum]|uniref:Phosphate-specific transport system accessory protein PhoU n=1 Tax=Ruminiclostridium cellulolyticum (strain ATCC 35319 / DSM 5812 / JCM 6584 / H10) TaxID=394503 RepID=B8I417_RUMCH|nr:phosphate signaling complex protein PhoU [Ruminiclostridium cellulolyticum]ACL76450.1 phosphate uptake regulator, PhoU [Ruminiclostridium cellulolyticum H10]